MSNKQLKINKQLKMMRQDTMCNKQKKKNRLKYCPGNHSHETSQKKL